MAHASIDISGPISRKLWNRLRRRARFHEGATAAVAAGAVYLAAAAEPNLSGIWVAREDTSHLLRLYHLAREVEGYHSEGGESFTARIVGEREIEGRINLYWQTDAQAEACGGYFSENVPFRGRIHASFETFEITYTATVRTDDTCAFVERTRVTERFMRHRT